MTFVKAFGKSKPLTSTKRFTKKCKNLRIRYGWGNVRSGKCLSGGNVRSGKSPLGKCPIRELSGRGYVRRGGVRRRNISRGSACLKAWIICLLFFYLNSFWTSRCFDLHKASLFKSFSLLSKSVFFTKPAISPLVVKLACFNLAVKFSAVKLYSGVAMYLLWSGVFFSTGVRAVLGAKLIICILFLTSFILALIAAVVAKVVILDISFLISFIEH